MSSDSEDSDAEEIMFRKTTNNKTKSRTRAFIDDDDLSNNFDNSPGAGNNDATNSSQSMNVVPLKNREVIDLIDSSDDDNSTSSSDSESSEETYGDFESESEVSDHDDDDDDDDDDETVQRDVQETPSSDSCPVSNIIGSMRKLDLSPLSSNSSSDGTHGDEDSEEVEVLPTPNKALFEKEPITVDSSSEEDKSSSKAESVDTKDKWNFDEDEREYYYSDFSGLRLPEKLFDRLYPHQKDGVSWMSKLHIKSVGGILGDDMGMGKTFQTLTFLSGLLYQRTIKNAIIVAPVSLLRTWEKEANDIVKEIIPNVTITVLHGVSKNKRSLLLRDALGCKRKYPHLVITTYGLVSSSPTDFVVRSYKGKDTFWDYVILDEGHKIKNPTTKVNKGCHWICRGTDGDYTKTRRLLLSGTPIQNNLKEFWALFDWAASGKLLGSRVWFQNRYGAPIEAGRLKDADRFALKIASKANKELQLLIQPHLLQRSKKDEFENKMPSKTDVVVWTHLSPRQRLMYENFVGDKHGGVAAVLRGEKMSPLVEITWLKKLCGHPILVADSSISSHHDNSYNGASLEDITVDQLMEDSKKLEAAHTLVQNLLKNGHRILIFSQSTKTLDVLEKVLKHFKHVFGRIDGQTKEKDRQNLVDKFNRNKKIPILLLSTKAAGLGLTLTGADRAIVYDPSWNPSEDSQAVDRCYRIGQEKPVVVYRLISAGTVEERMYEKQVLKDGIRRVLLTRGGNNTERHFERKDLEKMFQLSPLGVCEMIDRLGLYKGEKVIEDSSSIVGLTSHDDVYTNEEAEDLEESTSSEKFTRVGRARSVLMQHDNYRNDSFDKDFHENDHFKEPDYGDVLYNEVPDNDHEFNEGVVNSDYNENDKENQSSNVLEDPLDCLQNLQNKKVVQRQKIAECLNRINTFVSNGQNLEPSLKLLLNMLETEEDMGNGLKIRVHQLISTIANDIGWLEL